MGGRINRDTDGFAGRHRPAGKIGGKLQSAAIVPGSHRRRQLRRFRGYRPQSEAGRIPQQHTNQPGTQQNPQPVGNSFNHRRRFGRGVQRLRHLRQNLGATAFLAGDLGEAAGFQEAAQLSGEDSGFCGQVFVEEIGVGAMDKSRRADRLIADHQRSRHHRPGAILGGHQIAGRIQPVLADRSALLKGFDGDRALPSLEPRTPEPTCHRSVGLGSHQFVRGDALPEICSVSLKELARGFAKQPNQGWWRGAVSCRSGEFE